MLACVFIYLGHFFYFSRLTEILRWFDPIYQVASLLVYPLFYIYFRLLIKEKRFSIRKHGLFLAFPIIIFILYAFCAYSLPDIDFENWLYNKGQPSETFAIQTLNILSILIPIVFIGQVLLAIFGNLRLIFGYRKKAIQYFSDLWEIRSINVVILNVLMVVCGVSSVVLSILGRRYFFSELTGLILASTIFSISIFFIGRLGFQQKAINPTFSEAPIVFNESPEDFSAGHKQILLDKINNLFRNNKIHLNTKLTIQDIAQSVGTNRTYVSSIINQHYGVNFCSFVNNHRIEELEKVLNKYPELTNQVLAETCGFGSVDSLKRAVHGKTGLSVTAWKTSLKTKKYQNQGDL
jgi:AraC-like DNA-binding protein